VLEVHDLPPELFGRGKTRILAEISKADAWYKLAHSDPHRDRGASVGEAALSERVYQPTQYRTLSRKLAPSLHVSGGALSIAGGLGVWVRATELMATGLAPAEVMTTWGYDGWPGIAIAALGALTMIASVTWLLRFLVPKLVPIASSIALAALVGWQLPVIDREAAALADQAREQIDFVAFHAGYGWGAWCMLAGAVIAVLGSVAGVLREIDVRRGIPG
jgi:hypothetical protein